MGEERKVYKVLVESLKEKDHLEDQGVGGKMVSVYESLRQQVSPQELPLP
jgi:hypothetical protein